MLRSQKCKQKAGNNYSYKKACKGKHQCNINTKDKQENQKETDKEHGVENRTGARTGVATKSEASTQA